MITGDYERFSGARRRDAGCYTATACIRAGRRPISTIGILTLQLRPSMGRTGMLVGKLSRSAQRNILSMFTQETRPLSKLLTEGRDSFRMSTSCTCL